VINGEIPDHHGWLTYVHLDDPQAASRGAVTIS